MAQSDVPVKFKFRLALAFGSTALILAAFSVFSDAPSHLLLHIALVIAYGLVIATLLYGRRLSLTAYMESEAIAHALLDASNDAAILIDCAETILAMNDAGALPLGIPKREMPGKKLQDVFTQEHLKEWRTYLSPAILDGTMQVFTVQRGERHFENRVYPIKDANGKVVRLGLFKTDITERRRVFEDLKDSEERLRRAQEAARIGSWEIDLTDQTLWGSECAFSLYGFEPTPNHRLQLPDVQRIVQTHDRERMDLALRELIESNVRYDVEYRINRFSDGEGRIMHSQAELLRDEEGRPRKVIGTLQDVTERKLLEHQLIQAQKLEGIGTLAGGIAHDFNNLLAMVLGTAELMKRRLSENPDLHKHIDRIIETTHRGTSITKQLLLFSRQDFAELEAISLSHILTEVHEMMRHFLSKDITVHIDIGVQNGIIMGDTGYIHQALMNLAINARDAMPNGGTLTFSAQSVDPAPLRGRFSDVEDTQYIAVSVSDTGKGMSDDVRRKIFDPFFTTKDRGKGTGLGLAIVHSIVKSHHGFIDVRSELGKGTTFTMYFPAIAQRHEPSAPATDDTPKGKETILVVDDEEILREMLAEDLRDQGYEVMTASNGTEALGKYREHASEIELVITDLGMPNMDGEALFARLRAIDNSVKVIISSGYLDKSSKIEMIGKGVMDVLTKPYKFNEIRKAIRTVLDQPVQ